MTMSIAEYLIYNGSKCPECGAVDLEDGAGHNADRDWILIGVTCNACGATWDDIFTLSSYDNLQVSKKK